MSTFKEVTIDMKEMVDKYFKNSGFFGCEYTFSNLFIWRKKHNTMITEYKGFLLVRHKIDGQCYYYVPIGQGDLRDAIEFLMEDAKNCKSSLKFGAVTEKGKTQLKAAMPGMFEFKPMRDWYDYIYNAQDLIELKGKKYSSKRNHINKFELKNGTNCYEDLTPDNISECMETYYKWVNENERGNLNDEHIALTEALNNFEALGLKGGIIRVDDKVCAFTAGAEINSDVFCIHIEKGLSKCPGVYAVINRDFAKHNCSQYKFINREEDMGLPGLRKAKLSYKPAILLEKSVAFIKEV